MYNKMHDGPKLPGYTRSYTKPKASIAALQWAAESAGQSYGVFSMGLTPEDEARIQLEYDEMLRQRALAAKARQEEKALKAAAEAVEALNRANSAEEAENA